MIKEITLPIEYQTSSYHVNWSGRTDAGGNNNYESKISAQTSKSFQITDYMIWNDINFYWEAKGYAN